MIPDNNQIKNWIEKNRSSMVKFCQKVARTPSFSSEEGKLVKLIAAEMKKVGFDKVKIDRLGNIIGIVGNGKTKIMIDAHIDTVGIGDPLEWKRAGLEPFSGAIKDEAIWGRGMTDQKGAIAPMVYGGKFIKDFGLKGDYQIWFVGSCQEEDCDGAPINHIIEKEKMKPDFFISTEQTNLNVHRGHRGRMEIIVETEGKSCHASAPERGINAVYNMSYIVQEITELNNRLKDHDFLGKGTVAVTKIDCLTPSVNAVPASAKIWLDRRVTIGENKESSLKEIMDLPSVKKYNAKVYVDYYRRKSWRGYTVEQEKYFPTWLTPLEHPLVEACREAAQIALGRKPEITKWVFSTNGVGACGKHGIPGAGFGPGNEVYAHTVYERVPVRDLEVCAIFYGIIGEVLTSTLKKWGKKELPSVIR